MRMKTFLISAFLVPLLMFSQVLCTVTYAENIVILGNDSKPPKYYLDNGLAKGILVDIIKYVDNKMGYSLSIELKPWKRAYRQALNGGGGIIGLPEQRKGLRCLIIQKWCLMTF